MIVLNQMRGNKTDSSELFLRKARRGGGGGKSGVAHWKDKSLMDSTQMATRSPRLIFKNVHMRRQAAKRKLDKNQGQRKAPIGHLGMCSSSSEGRRVALPS